MNLPYDILHLRACFPSLRAALDGKRHWLTDLAHLIYLEYDQRPEKSLKAIGNILNTHRYTQTLKDGRFPSPASPAFIEYSASDPHNVVLACAALARRITRRAFKPQLEPSCLDFFSALTWVMVRMTEAGICFSESALLAEKSHHESACAAANEALLPYVLEGPGSVKQQQAFLETILTHIEETSDPLIRSSPLLALTEKKKQVAFSDINRNLFKPLVSDPDLRSKLSAWEQHTYSSKMLSSFINPLFNGRDGKSKDSPRNHSTTSIPVRLFNPTLASSSSSSSPSPSSSEAAPLGELITWKGSLTNPDARLCFPRWFSVPSGFKDDSSDGEGGQRQVRPSVKDPAAQTFPPPLRRCITSRMKGGVQVSYDFSQIELRIAACLSGDPVLLRAYRENRDLHRDLAVEMEGESILSHPHFGDGTPDDPRQWYKQCNFGGLNWISDEGLQALILRETGKSVPLPLCTRMVSQRRITYSVLTAYQESVLNAVEKTGYFVLPITGHSRYFGTNPRASGLTGEVINFPIQGIAAAINLSMQARLHETLPPLNASHPGIFMYLNVYDAIKFDCHPSCVDLLDTLYRDALSHLLSPTGFLGLLFAHTGHPVPIKFSRELKPST